MARPCVLLSLLALALASSSSPTDASSPASPDPSMVCIGCTLITALSMEGAFDETHAALAAVSRTPSEQALARALSLDAASVGSEVTPASHCKDRVWEGSGRGMGGRGGEAE